MIFLKYNDWLVRLLRRISLGIVVLLVINACQDKLHAQRSALLLAEKHIAANDEAGFVTVLKGLEDYPLYPYLRYQWLKDHLTKPDAVADFLGAEKNTPYAALLRGKWLDYLAKQNNWQAFIRYYQPNEKSRDDCRWLWANYQTGNIQMAMVNAKRLWLSGVATSECQALFSNWMKSEVIPLDLAWQRFEATLFQNKVDAAKAVTALLSAAEKQKAENWLSLHADPSRLEEKRFWPEHNAQAGRFFADAVIRLADADPANAVTIWKRTQKKFDLDEPLKNRVEQALGMEFLAEKDARAFEQLGNATLPDASARTARLRAALLTPDWRQVMAAVFGLTEAERSEPQAQYWYARALQETGQQAHAETVYRKLATDRSFYGFMAADKINSPYKSNDQPIKPDLDVVAALADQPAFIACREFKFFNKDVDVRRQWQFAIKGLTKEKLLAAVKLAQVWQLDQQAIITLVKAGYWDDITVRFPVRYAGEINAAAEKNKLDPSLILGLIRQESMFDPNAASAVGALGLMQMMPPTARIVAAQLKQPWGNDKDLFKPENNISFGTHYFSGLQTQFSQLTPVAIAAYNAGPGRVKRWLPHTVHVPADIWIDTIPYKETRKYVANVLTYAILYQQRLKKNGLKMQDLLPDIGPV